MQRGNSISFDEMVLEFLRAEIRSPRFAERYTDWMAAKHIHTSTNLEQLPSAVRRSMLWECRAGICRTLPKETVWYEAVLEGMDMDRVLFMNHEPWIPFSHGTRRVELSLDRLRQPQHRVLTKHVQEIQEDIKHGVAVPKIIILTNSEYSKFVIVEGHVRTVAYIALQSREIPVILGISPQADTWTWW